MEAIAQDISERKHLEDQLRQSQKMEAVGQLAGGIAHDFNNLLGVMVGHGDLLLRRLSPGSPLRRHAQEILKVAETTGGLVRQLLAFGRKQVIQRRSTSCSPMW